MENKFIFVKCGEILDTEDIGREIEDINRNRFFDPSKNKGEATMFLEHLSKKYPATEIELFQRVAMSEPQPAVIKEL